MRHNVLNLKPVKWQAKTQKSGLTLRVRLTNSRVYVHSKPKVSASNKNRVCSLRSLNLINRICKSKRFLNTPNACLKTTQTILFTKTIKTSSKMSTTSHQHLSTLLCWTIHNKRLKVVVKSRTIKKKLLIYNILLIKLHWILSLLIKSATKKYKVKTTFKFYTQRTPNDPMLLVSTWRNFNFSQMA